MTLASISASRGSIRRHMPRKIPFEALRALFAKSGNVCAFPGCTTRIVSDDNKMIGQICHIEGAEPGGERFNPAQTEEERNGYGNLVLMCYPHHVDTDNVEKYSVETLRKIKNQHEAQFFDKPYKVNESFLHKMESDMEAYFERVRERHEKQHAFSELRVPVDFSGTNVELYDSLQESIKDLKGVFRYMHKDTESLNDVVTEFMEKIGYDTTQLKAVPYYENPLIHRYFMDFNMSIANRMSQIELIIMQIQVRHLADYLKINPTDGVAKTRLEKVKEEFERLAQSMIYVD